MIDYQAAEFPARYYNPPPGYSYRLARRPIGHRAEVWSNYTYERPIQVETRWFLRASGGRRWAQSRIDMWRVRSPHPCEQPTIDR